MRIATFNVQSLRLRGDHLSGAHDDDTPERADRVLDHRDRLLTARVIRDLEADVLALQEVFDSATLDHFHDHYLRAAGVPPYPHRICLPGNDGRGLDIAVLSRSPPHEVVSHAALLPADLGLAVPPGLHAETPIFRRDCLRLELTGLTLFVVHFKAPTPDPETARRVRALEASALRALIKARFDDPASAMWLILGDLNDPWDANDTPATAPVLPPFSIDLMDRIPQDARWTCHDPWSGRYGQPDQLLASPALALACRDAIPRILRHGMSLEAARHPGPHLPDVGRHRPHASDHAALVIDTGRFTGPSGTPY